MKRIFLILLVVANIQASANKVNPYQDESTIANDKVAVVKCYANWCGYCKKFAEPYQELANEKSSDAKFYEVDADTPAGKSFAGKYAKQGFPTTVIFNYGKKVDDVVGGKVDELREKIDAAKNAKPAPSVIKDSEKLEDPNVQEATSCAYLKQPGIVVVKFHADWCTFCKPYAKPFARLAEDFKDFAKFFEVDIDKCPDIQSEYNITGLPRTLILDSGKVVYEIGGSNDSSVRRTLERLQRGEKVNSPVITVDGEDKPSRSKATANRKTTKKTMRKPKKTKKRQRILVEEDEFIDEE